MTTFNQGKLDSRVTDSIQDLKNNEKYEEQDFVPKEFPLCDVRDERFEASVRYLAKGRFPADEQVIAWAGNSNLLEEHNALMRKLAQ